MTGNGESRTATVPQVVLRRAAAHGADGLAWLASLDNLATGLARDWSLTLGRTLSGGTAALVIEADTSSGQSCVLKLAAPWEDGDGNEARVLNAAAGCGFPRLLAYDPERHALLLERLGGQLQASGLPIDDQLTAICGALRLAWTAKAPPGLMSGAEKAAWLAVEIDRLRCKLGPLCDDRTVELAIDFADRRERAHDPANCVLVHGDAHAWNTLADPRSQSGWKLIDPDGLWAEPACDLAVPMREWGAELLAGDPAALGRERCLRLSALTGVATEPIWQWGFVERVSSGLLLADLGMSAESREFLAVADAWAAAERGTAVTRPTRSGTSWPQSRRDAHEDPHHRTVRH